MKPTAAFSKKQTQNSAADRPGQLPVGQRRAPGAGPALPAGQAMASNCPRLRGPLQLQERISAALERPAAASPRRASAAPAAARQAGVVQRIINTRLPVKFYRRAGGSAASQVNIAIEEYNQASQANTLNPDSLLRKLAAIQTALAGVSAKKQAEKNRIAAEIQTDTQALQQERLRSEAAVADVMRLANAKARGQLAAPKVRSSVDNQALTQYIETREVLHATNPLKLVGAAARPIGDLLAEYDEIKNIHQTHYSLVGGNNDGAKRLVAEIGLFYPESYRRASFSRLAHRNASATKGIGTRPPADALPIYGALNLANSPRGALPTNNTMSLHFAIKPDVLRTRTTFMASDSLRQWIPLASGFRRLCRATMLPEAVIEKEAEASLLVPTDGEPWQMGPIATYETGNFGQLLAHANQNPATCLASAVANPDEYVEAQIHGGLRISEDVSHVRANFSRLFGHPRFEALYFFLREKAIPVHWYYAEADGEPGQLVQTWEGQPEPAEAYWQAARAVRKQQHDLLTQQIARGTTHPLALSGLLEDGLMADDGKAKLRGIWKEWGKLEL